MAIMVGGGVIPVAAQDDLVTCDSDLILQLYIAEYYFNFAGLRGQLMDLGTYYNFAPFGTLTEVDLEQFDKGQYTPIFAELATMMGDDGMVASAMINQATATELMTMLPMTDDEMATMIGDDMPADALLMPIMMTDEPAECQTLRAELRHFFTVVAIRDIG